MLAQKINLNNDCLNKNTVIFSRFLIEQEGREFVEKILKNKQSYLMFFEIDCFSGQVIKYLNLRSHGKIIRKEFFVDKLESKIITNNLFFDLCFQSLPGKTKEEAMDLIKKGFAERGEKTCIINVAFPGELMMLYDYYLSRQNEDSLSLSRLNYLEMKIRERFSDAN